MFPFKDEEGHEISCDLSMTSTENDPLDVQAVVHPPDPNTTDGGTGCFVDGNPFAKLCYQDTYSR